MGIGNLALGYFAGVLSTLSPCVLPILPVVLFGALEKHRLAPLAIAGGLSFAFVVLGVCLATFGLSFHPAVVRTAAAVLMLAAGLAFLLPRLQAQLAVAAGPLMNGGQSLAGRIQPKGLPGLFLLGAALGAVWTPCVGPTLGAAVALAAKGENLANAAAVMTAFALGASTPILALAYGSRQAIMLRRDRLARFSQIAKPLTGATLIVLALAVLTGLDKRIETALTNAMPEWLLDLTTRL
jgi:cytochrome c-type biogenesis protein